MSDFAVKTKAPSNKQSLRIGSIIMQDAYTTGGVLLLPAGSIINTPKVLRRLLRSDVRFGENMAQDVSVDIQNEQKMEMCEDNQEVSFSEFSDRVKHAHIVKSEVVKNISSVFSRFAQDGEVDSSCVRETASILLNEMILDQCALLSLVRLKDTDSYTFTHCVNVSILSIYLAMRSGNQKYTEDIAIGAILHDIGKLNIPASVLHKNGTLNPTEWGIMRKHPTIGAEMVSQCGRFGEIVLACVRDHHEKMYGNGYPDGKQGKNINVCARITAIADVYDALTTTRPYRNAMNPRDALLLMTQQMGKDFDVQLLDAFVSSVGYFPVGSTIELSIGMDAVVTKNHLSNPLRPTVIVIGKNGAMDYSLDLRKNKSVFIKNFSKERSAVDIALEETI